MNRRFWLWWMRMGALLAGVYLIWVGMHGSPEVVIIVLLSMAAGLGGGWAFGAWERRRAEARQAELQRAIAGERWRRLRETMTVYGLPAAEVDEVLRRAAEWPPLDEMIGTWEEFAAPDQRDITWKVILGMVADLKQQEGRLW